METGIAATISSSAGGVSEATDRSNAEDSACNLSVCVCSAITASRSALNTDTPRWSISKSVSSEPPAATCEASGNEIVCQETNETFVVINPATTTGQTRHAKSPVKSTQWLAAACRLSHRDEAHAELDKTVTAATVITRNSATGPTADQFSGNHIARLRCSGFVCWKGLQTISGASFLSWPRPAFFESGSVPRPSVLGSPAAQSSTLRAIHHTHCPVLRQPSARSTFAEAALPNRDKSDPLHGESATPFLPSAPATCEQCSARVLDRPTESAEHPLRLVHHAPRRSP